MVALFLFSKFDFISVPICAFKHIACSSYYILLHQNRIISFYNQISAVHILYTVNYLNRIKIYSNKECTAYKVTKVLTFNALQSQKISPSYSVINVL